MANLTKWEYLYKMWSTWIFIEEFARFYRIHRRLEVSKFKWWKLCKKVNNRAKFSFHWKQLWQKRNLEKTKTMVGCLVKFFLQRILSVKQLFDEGNFSSKYHFYLPYVQIIIINDTYYLLLTIISKKI